VEYIEKVENILYLMIAKFTLDLFFPAIAWCEKEI